MSSAPLSTPTSAVEDADAEALLHEDPVVAEKKSKKYEIKLRDLRKKHQELCARGEVLATQLRSQLQTLASLRRDVSFLKQRKACWDDVYNNGAGKKRKHSDKTTITASKRGRDSGAGGGRSTKRSKARREEGEAVHHVVAVCVWHSRIVTAAVLLVSCCVLCCCVALCVVLRRRRYRGEQRRWKEAAGVVSKDDSREETQVKLRHKQGKRGREKMMQ